MTELPHPLSRDRAVSKRDARRRRRPPALLGAVRDAGRQAGRVPPRRARAADRTTSIAASSTRRAMTSCCSTSAAAGDRRRTPALTPTRPGTWSPTSSGCASMAGIEQVAGVRRQLGLDAEPRLRPDASRARHRTGAARHLPVRPVRDRLALPQGRRVASFIPTNGTSSSRRSRRTSAATWSRPIAGG